MAPLLKHRKRDEDAVPLLGLFCKKGVAWQYHREQSCQHNFSLLIDEVFGVALRLPSNRSILVLPTKFVENNAIAGRTEQIQKSSLLVRDHVSWTRKLYPNQCVREWRASRKKAPLEKTLPPL